MPPSPFGGRWLRSLEGWWYQYYFSTERGRIGYSKNRREFNKLIWQIASPKWDFDDDTFERTAALPHDLVSIAPEGLEAQADWASLTSPVTYLGYEQARGFASPGDTVLDQTHDYLAPGLNLNHWALTGDWTIERRAIVLDRAGGRILFRFHARDIHLVIGPRPRGASVPFRVLIDGEPPSDARGIDTDEQGRGTVAQQRLYHLIRKPGSITDRTFEITFLAPGVEAYVFTFG